MIPKPAFSITAQDKQQPEKQDQNSHEGWGGTMKQKHMYQYEGNMQK